MLISNNVYMLLVEYMCSFVVPVKIASVFSYCHGTSRLHIYIQHLGRWLKRVVLGSSSDGPSEVALSVSHLFKFVELLTIEDR